MSAMNDIIRERRKELGLTQKELADILSISDKTVSRWESGNQIPDAILLPDLAEALKITLNDLYGLTEDSKIVTKVASEKVYPKENFVISTVYRIAMVLGLVLFIFGAMLLTHINAIKLFSDGERVFGNAFMYSGMATCIVFEIAYIIFYRNKHFYNPVYLCEDIKYSGLCAVCICFVAMVVFPLLLSIRISYWYELVTVMLLVAFEALLLFQKRKLRTEGIDIGKKISIISAAIVAACSLVMLAVFVYFKFFYIDDSEAWVQLIYELSGGSPFETKVRTYSYMLLSFLMVSALLVNYIQLLIKSKKLAANKQ